MAKIIRGIKGTRDFYPDEMAKRAWLIEKMQKVSQSFGYEQYDGPCLESLELYAAKSGEELVKEQSFVFPDRGGDLIALRPELTPTLARMVASKQNELAFPLRWWSFGPFWRYERPQKGRSREFFQWNVDLIGVSSPQADAEVVTLAADFFRNVGLRPEQVKILVNNRKLIDSCLTEIGVEQETRPKVFRLIDKLDKLSPTSWDDYALQIGLSSQNIADLKALLQDTTLWKRSEELNLFFNSIENLGVKDYVQYDPTVIRGLDYYTGTVFEGRDASGKLRAIFGGGHYDNLVEDVGGEKLPGVGFAMGDVVIQLILEEYNCFQVNENKNPFVLVCAFDDLTRSYSDQVARMLRENGYDVSSYLLNEKLAKQFKYADRIGAKIVIVAGPDELENQKVSIKNLETGKQITIPISGLIQELSVFLADA